jgi:hypothetical protein
MLYFTFILLVSFVAFGLFYFFSKKTHLCINIKDGNVWPLLIYRELFFVFSALLLVAAYGLDVFERSIPNARVEDLFAIFAITIYAVFGFLISTLIFARIFKVPLFGPKFTYSIDPFKLRRFANAAVLTGFIVLLFSIFFLGFQHAFILALMAGGDLLAVRLNNAYNSQMPSQLGQVIRVAWWIISIYVGYLVWKKNYIQSLIYFCLGLLLASAHGDKAPVLQFLIVAGFSFASFNGIKISGKYLFKFFIIYFPLIYVLLFGIVSLQIPELNFEAFNIYLLNRLGVGQMSGVFETFSMPRLDGDFVWHVVPGASFFVNYIPYDKVLMMVTEGYGFSEMGVKNSLFISEAYGIGGLPLALISPFIVGFSYSLGICLLSKFLLYLFGSTVSIVFALPIYILSAALTGGFSSFPLFKGLILTMACLGLIWIMFFLLRMRFR